MSQHKLLKDYVRTLVQSDQINSLVIRGAGGIGKSYTIVQALDKQGLIRNKHYILMTGHITPLALYKMIGNSASLSHPRLIVFDDVDAIVQNKTSIALLKSALWEIDGKRLVSYNSTSSKIEGPTTVEFTGKVIIVLNNIKQENAFGKPLLDRGIMFDMTMQPQEVIQYVEKIMPKLSTPISLEQRLAVWEQIKRFADNPSFSIRSLLRAMEFFHLDPDNWLTLYVNTLSLSSEQKILYSVREEFKTVKEQEKAWITQTGMGRAQFYRTKKSIKVS